MSSAGLVPLLRLADAAGLTELLAEHLTVGSPNAAAKAGCVIGGMLAGADSIDDLDLLRHGAMRKVFTGLRAPSTLGTYLRAFTHGHVQQLDAVGARWLAGLAARAPGLLAGADTAEGIAFVALAIRTTFTPPGQVPPYNDAIAPDRLQRYKYRGTDPDHPENVALRRAFEQSLPFI